MSDNRATKYTTIFFGPLLEQEVGNYAISYSFTINEETKKDAGWRFLISSASSLQAWTQRQKLEIIRLLPSLNCGNLSSERAGTILSGYFPDK